MPRKNFLSETHPELLEEWDYRKNQLLGLDPEKLTAGSDKRPWWKCKTCRYSWTSTIYKRASLERGCLNCAGRVVTEDNNLLVKCPDIVRFWDFEQNAKGPECYKPSSAHKVYFKCYKCDYKWKTRINYKVSSTGALKTGCPACKNTVVNKHNSFVENASNKLLKEWSDKNIIDVNGIHIYSHRRVLRESSVCSYEWRSIVKNRTKNNQGCPKCSGRVVSDKNSLVKNFPKVAGQWSSRNKVSVDTICYGSDKRYWWKCHKGHEWEASPNNRTNNDSGCLICFTEGASKVSQEWLDSLGVKQREVQIGPYRVDGFDPKTNTVYEFLGDYWHGNPKVFSKDEINPSNGKSFGQLFIETNSRVSCLKKMGYRVVYIWENDFNVGKHSQ